RRLDEQLRDAAARQAKQLVLSRATTLQTQGALRVPETAEVVRQPNPGVKAIVKKETTLFQVAPNSGTGPTSKLAKGARCIMHPVDKSFAFVEVLRPRTQKEKDDGDTAAKITARGYTMLSHLEPMQQWVPVKGPVFTQVPSPDDVKQGALGDCYFLAALASIAAANPDAIQGMMCDNGDSVTVRFYDTVYDTDPNAEIGAYEQKPTYITIEKSVLDSSGKLGNKERAGGQRAGGALWVQLLEKAYATHVARSHDKLKPGDLNAKSRSLAGIEGGAASDALKALLGRPGYEKKMPGHGSSAGRLEGVLRVAKFQLNDVTEAKVRSIDRVKGPTNDGVGFEAPLHKAFIDAVIRAMKKAGGQFPMASDLQEALKAAGLFDSRGQVAADCIPGGVDPRLTVQDVIQPITKALFTMPPPELVKLQNSAAYTKLTAPDRAGKELRQDELAGLITCPEFLALPPKLQQKFQRGLDAEFSGKRFTGVYSDNQLEVWDEISRGLDNNALVCLGTPTTVGRKADGEGHSAGEKKSKGLAGNHAYSVLGVYQPKVGEPGYVRPQPGGEAIRYLRVRNPWGHYGRVYGEGKNDKGELAPRRAQAADEGEFLLELTDVTRRFEKLYVTDPLPSLFGPEQQRALREEIGRLCGLTRAFKADRDGLYKDAAAVGERNGLEAAIDFVAESLGVNREHERILAKLVQQYVGDVDGVDAVALYEKAAAILYLQGANPAAAYVKQYVKENGKPKPLKPDFGDKEELLLAEYVMGLAIEGDIDNFEIYNAACKRGRAEGLKAAKAYAAQFAKETNWTPKKDRAGRRPRLLLRPLQSNEGEGGAGEKEGVEPEQSRDKEVVEPDEVRKRLVRMREQAEAGLHRWTYGPGVDEDEKEAKLDDDMVAVRKTVFSYLIGLEERVTKLLDEKKGAGPTRRELADICDDHRSRAAADQAFKASDELIVPDALSPRATVLAAADVLVE
ncbi:MAG TPA: C2 family cysteine protease, partial [Gemmataceae bacterium]|nr:C2 family cysteine protease [Gemmataceae bacterium]